MGSVRRQTCTDPETFIQQGHVLVVQCTLCEILHISEDWVLSLSKGDNFAGDDLWLDLF